MTRLAPRDRRALSLGIVAVMGTLLVAGGVPRWRAWEAESLDLAWYADSRLGGVVQALRDSAAIADSLQGLRAGYLALAPGLLGGRSAATAGAEMLGLISLAATRAGLRVESLQATGDSAAGRAFVRVAVRGDLTGDVLALAGFLAAVEGGPHRFSLRELSIDQPEPGRPGDQAETLRIRFVAEGVAVRGGPPS